MDSDDNSLIFNFTSQVPERKKPHIFDKSIVDEIQRSPIKQFQKPRGDKGSTVKNRDESRFHNRGPKQANQQQLSSIFQSNPDVPPLIVLNQKSPSETLFSEKTFSELNLHSHLVSCLKSRMKIEKMTQVQNQTIPILLNAQDALVKSCTGSGKTLSYAVPIVQYLQAMDPKVKRSDGVFALVIVPTRELALQCHTTFSTLTQAFTRIVPGYLIGGEKKKSEKARLRKGINILISTPGRLLDHLDHTACLSLDKLEWLVIDEADRLLEQGFEEAIAKIVSKCKPSRHGVLLSATLSKEVENLAGLSLSNPVCVDISSESTKSSSDFQDLVIPENLKQFITIVPAKLRLAAISGFIVDNCSKGGFKGLIFMFSQTCVEYHLSLLSEVLTPVMSSSGHKCKFFQLHGNMKQEDRTEIFSAFRSVKEGILLCTDVAARGLDLLSVDWIVQYSVPESAEVYVHRVGRTARIGKKGKSLLFLLPSESLFANLLSEHKISFEELPPEKLLVPLQLLSDHLRKRGYKECASALQLKYEDLVYSEEKLREKAKEAFASYVQSYASYPKATRAFVPFKGLHLGHLAKSFCLREAPSALGVAVPNHRFPNQRNDPGFVNRKFPNDTRPPKRKMQAAISEYDSGLSFLKDDTGKKSKKRKH